MLDVLAFLSHLPSLSFASAHVPFLYHQLLSLGLQETGKKKKRGGSLKERSMVAIG